MHVGVLVSVRVLVLLPATSTDRVAVDDAAADADDDVDDDTTTTNV